MPNIEKKKHISNLELNAKYMKKREDIKRDINHLIEKINSSLKYYFPQLKDKYEFNEFNHKLFREKTEQLSEFRESIIAAWKDILSKDILESNEDINKILVTASPGRGI